MMRLNIKKNPKFALVGHGYHLNFFFDELIKNRLPKPIIITHQKKLHLRDIKNSKNDQSLYRSVFELENKTKVFYIDDINSKKNISILKSPKPIVRLNEFGECGLVFMLRAFVSSSKVLMMWDIMADVRLSVFNKFRENKITVVGSIRVIKVHDQPLVHGQISGLGKGSEKSNEK
mgnify:CR=1 FL=1